MHNITDILQNHTSAKKASIHIQQLYEIHCIWLELISLNQNTHGIDKVLFEKSTPISIHNNTLNISCETNIIANHFRFAEKTVLHLLKKQGIKNIHTIKTSTNLLQLNANSKKTSTTVHREVQKETILALEQLLAFSKSKQLNKSIKKLLIQLKNFEQTQS